MNVLPWRSVDLKPAEVRDFVFEIDRSTSKVSIEFEDLAIPDNSRPVMFPNALEVNLQSAKRSAAERPVAFLLDADFGAAVGGAFTIEVEDGLWSFAGVPVAEQPMEPGLMKLSLAGDFVNENAVGTRVRITRENEAERLQKPISKSVISQDDVFIVPVDVPEGTAQATFNLRWQRDWSRFPTSDLDLILYDPDMNVITDGATLNAPERAVVKNPDRRHVLRGRSRIRGRQDRLLSPVRPDGVTEGSTPRLDGRARHTRRGRPSLGGRIAEDHALAVGVIGELALPVGEPDLEAGSLSRFRSGPDLRTPEAPVGPPRRPHEFHSHGLDRNTEALREVRSGESLDLVGRAKIIDSDGTSCTGAAQDGATSSDPDVEASRALPEHDPEAVREDLGVDVVLLGAAETRVGPGRGGGDLDFERRSQPALAPGPPASEPRRWPRRA